MKRLIFVDGYNLFLIFFYAHPDEEGIRKIEIKSLRRCAFA
jgi:hypothetical protein